jgi:O-antigen ligase
LILIALGTSLLLAKKNKVSLPKTIILFFVFYFIYYLFGTIATIYHDFDRPIAKTIIPVIYFCGFSIFLNDSENRVKMIKVIITTFTISNILLIYLKYINFDLDRDGIYEYTLERAGGVYGDANNAAVVCLLAFIFLTRSFFPRKYFFKLIKFLGIIVALYGLFLTFSKTGFLVFIIILGFIYYKFFNPKRILFVISFIPLFSVILIQSALKSDILSLKQKSRISDIVNILTFQSENVDFSGRDVLFSNMINHINENPFLGNGIDFGKKIRGHNTIFGIWADAGFLAFILFLVVLLSYFVISWRSSKEIRSFTIPILLVLSIFMLTLQTIINQPYLIVLFPLMSYLIESDNLSNKNLEINQA